MSGAFEEYANVMSPNMGKISVIAVATSSGTTDLSAAGELNGEESKGILTLQADGGKVWYFFHTVGGTADDAALTGNNRVFVLADGQERRHRLRDGAVVITHKGSAACKLRIYRSGSLGPGTD